jgi:hypothetical protein
LAVKRQTATDYSEGEQFKIKGHLSQLESMQNEIYDFIKAKAKELRGPVPLEVIREQFDFKSNLAFYQSIVNLYDHGKLHEVRYQEYLPWDL